MITKTRARVCLAIGVIGIQMCYAKTTDLDLSNPHNYTWPYSIFIATKRKLGFPIVAQTPKASFLTRLGNTIKTIYDYHVSWSKPIKNVVQQRKLIRQATSLLTQHLALASRFSNDTLAKIICNPVSLAWCQLAYGFSLDLVRVKQLLNGAGYSQVSASRIGHELFVQSRAAVQTSKIQKLFRLFVRKKFNLTPLLMKTKIPDGCTHDLFMFDLNW